MERGQYIAENAGKYNRTVDPVGFEHTGLRVIHGQRDVVAQKIIARLHPRARRIVLHHQPALCAIALQSHSGAGGRCAYGQGCRTGIGGGSFCRVFGIRGGLTGRNNGEVIASRARQIRRYLKRLALFGWRVGGFVAAKLSAAAKANQQRSNQCKGSQNRHDITEYGRAHKKMGHTVTYSPAVRIA